MTTRKTAKLKAGTRSAVGQQHRSSTQQTARAESKQARIIAMLRAPSGATIDASMQRSGSRIRCAASSQASSAKNSALILYRRQLKPDASIGLRIARLQLLWRPKRAMRGNAMRRARSVARKTTEGSLENEIARLRGLDIDTLRARWRTVFTGKTPPHLPRHLLFAMIAYRLQAEVLGDLDAETLRLLKKIDLAPSRTEAVPLTKAFEQRKRELSPGTIRIREWNSQTHRLMVVEQGFTWESSTYDSLSKIAQAITGTKWNGPRFFGLRDKRSAEVAP
jgi:Protein of unknown function (DUF2924)